MGKPGEDFEKAVHEFISSLDPTARVRHNVQIPDRDTGEPRQVDVLADLKYGKHLPYRLVVSCKDHSRKLHQGDIGQFIDELRSVNGHVGVIYSRHGFTKPALAKAAKNCISCCRLYLNEPAEKPTDLFLRQYISVPMFWVEAKPLAPSIEGAAIRWRDIVKTPLVLDFKKRQLAGHLALIMNELQETVQEGPGHRSIFPQPHAKWFRLDFRSSPFPPILIDVGCCWQHYAARSQAMRLRGSLNLTEGRFSGSSFGPAIPMRALPSPEDWVPISPSSSERVSLGLGMRFLSQLTGADIAHSLWRLEVFDPKRVVLASVTRTDDRKDVPHPSEMEVLPDGDLMIRGRRPAQVRSK